MGRFHLLGLNLVTERAVNNVKYSSIVFLLFKNFLSPGEEKSCGITLGLSIQKNFESQRKKREDVITSTYKAQQYIRRWRSGERKLSGGKFLKYS
jgi:hypothetical protein